MLLSADAALTETGLSIRSLPKTKYDSGSLDQQQPALLLGSEIYGVHRIV
jgi:hypothetical protein